MPNPWTSTQKTNLTSVESAINTALGSLGSANDPWQHGQRNVLLQMLRLLDQLKVERNA